MDILYQILKVFTSEDHDNHKKNDDVAIGREEEQGVSIQMEENPEQNIQEFIQQTLEYFQETLGRPLSSVNDLRYGLGRTGDGMESELLWWTPVEHPVGAMLFQNPQVSAKCVIEAGRHGKVAIYSDADVRLCIEEITEMIFTHRSIKLERSSGGLGREKAPITNNLDEKIGIKSD